MTREDANLAAVPAAAAEGRAAAAAPARRYRYSEAGGGASPPVTVALGLGEPRSPIQWQPIWLVLAVAGLLMVFLYPTDLQRLVARWISDAGWSHGFVVPLISAFFIRLKWDTLRELTPQGSLWGLGVIFVGVCGQVLYRATGISYMSDLSILVVLFGVVLFIFGWEYLKILWLPIAYLGFAIPPPTPLYVMVTIPMQTMAAELGVQLLPLVGGEGVRNGTTLHVAFGGKSTDLFVEQACAGMRMLVAFFALAVALAYSTERPVWQKVTLAICALPIAIICNGMRVMMTGFMSVKVNPDWARGNAHEYFGLLMLGPALVMQLGIAWAMDRMFVDVPEEKGGGK